LPEVLDRDDFRTVLASWLNYRGSVYKAAGLTAMVSRAANLAIQFGVPTVIEAMQRAMANGWKGWDHSIGENNGRPQRTGTGQRHPDDRR
jgi:hypothetical protein